MKRSLFTAAEIAAMRIPGLPTTKANVIERAKREAWPYELRMGQGGERKVYSLPAVYEPRASALRSSSSIDVQRLSDIIEAVEEALTEKGKRLPATKKAQLIALLYEQSLGADAKTEVDDLLERLLSLTL